MITGLFAKVNARSRTMQTIATMTKLRNTNSDFELFVLFSAN